MSSDTTERIDLLDFDGGYETTEADENSFDNVPDGTYQVNVEKAILTLSKNTGRPMLSWTLKIMGPQHKGRLLFRHNVISTDTLKWLKTDLFRCGLTDVKPSTLEANLSRLLDLKLEVKVQTKGENQNIWINKKLDLASAEAASEPSDPNMGHF